MRLWAAKPSDEHNMVISATTQYHASYLILCMSAINITFIFIYVICLSLLRIEVSVGIGQFYSIICVSLTISESAAFLLSCFTYATR